MLEKDESFKWGTSNQDLSYHSNKITPYSILQKTEQPTIMIIFEKQCQDLGLDIVVLRMAKFQKKSIQTFLRKLRVKFHAVKIQLKMNHKLYPQELTK